MPLIWSRPPGGNDLTPVFIELPISRNYRHGGWNTLTPFFRDVVHGHLTVG